MRITQRLLLTLVVLSSTFALRSNAQQSTSLDPASEQTMPAFRKAGSSQTYLQQRAKQSAQQTSLMRPAPAAISAPVPISSRNYIGAELGLTSSAFGGGKNFFWSIAYPFNTALTENIPFSDHAVGFGGLLGGVIDLSLSDVIGLQGKIRVHSNNTSGKESLADQSCPSSDGSPGTATFTGEYSNTAWYGGLDALLRFQITPNALYALAGLEFKSLIGDNFSISRTIDASTNDCQWLDEFGQQTGLKRYDVKTSTTDIFNSTRTGIDIGVGTFLPLDNGMVLTPELMVSIPMSEFFQKDEVDAYKTLGTTPPTMTYAALTIALKFPFGGSASAAEDETIVQTSGNSSGVTAGVDQDDRYHLKGRVTDRAGNPIEARVSAVELSSSETVAEGRTDRDGKFDLKVDRPGKYSVTADADGYLFNSAFFEVDNQGRILRGRHDIVLSEGTGRTRLLVFFDFDKSSLQSASFPELNRAVTLMKANPKMEVEIAGYTDSKGTDEYNIDLSQRRANAVKDYLISKGIPKSRVTAKGYGEASPIADNETEDGRSENRRVEFVVLRR